MYGIKLKRKIKNNLRLLGDKYNIDLLFIFQGSIWFTLQKILGISSALIIGILFANFIDPAEYGKYKYIISTAEIFGSLSLASGLYFITTRSISKNKYIKLSQVTKKIFYSHILFFLIGISISTYYFYQGNSQIGSSFLAITILFPFLQSVNVFKPALDGAKLFKISTIFGIKKIIINLIIMSAPIYLGFSYLWLIISNYGSRLLASTLNYRSTTKILKQDTDLSKKEIKSSFHLSTIGVLGAMGAHIDKLLIFHYLGAVEVAIYSFATIIPQQIEGFIKQGQALSIQKLSNKSNDYIKKSVLKKAIQFFPILIIISIGYYFIAPYIFTILFPKYQASIPYTQLYALIFLTYFDITPFAFIAGDMIKQKYIRSTIKVITRLIFFIILIPTLGINGAIFSIIISNLISSIFGIILIKKSSFLNK